MKTATLALENGQTFEGVSIGADGETTGEVVFNTSLTGYQEVLTDPSYSGQIVTMTAAPEGRDSTRRMPVRAPGRAAAGAGRSGPRTRASWNDTVVPADRASTATRRVSAT